MDHCVAWLRNVQFFVVSTFRSGNMKGSRRVSSSPTLLLLLLLQVVPVL